MVMLRLLQSLLRTLVPTIQTHRALALENLALRQQVALLKSTGKRPRPSAFDRLFWVALARWWSDWRSALLIVTPDTVIRWHREGFRRYWHWRSRPRPPGRPPIDLQLRQGPCPPRLWPALTRPYPDRYFDRHWSSPYSYPAPGLFKGPARTPNSPPTGAIGFLLILTDCVPI